MISIHEGSGSDPAGMSGGVTVGDRVAALWSDGHFYLGKVTAAKGGKLQVLFEDGDHCVVNTAELLRTEAADAAIAVGTRVLAAWRGAAMFTGVVTATTAQTVTVQWDDGDEPLVVAKDRVVAFAASKAATGLRPGSRVAALWGDGSYWGATIEKVAGERVTVLYDDGDRAVRGAAELLPITSEEIVAGSEVLACWRGEARMFPGTVTGRRGDCYTVKWDDGDMPTEEPRENIVVLRRG